MKVLHVTPSVARNDGGPAEVIRGLLPALHACGIQADVLTTDKGLQEYDRDLLDARWVHVEKGGGPASLTYSASLPRYMKGVIDDYDLVHVHGLQSYVGTQAMKLARRAGVPYLLEPHGALDTYHWRRHALRKRIYSRAVDRKNWRGLAGVKYSSGYEARQGARTLEALTTLVIPLGVDRSLFRIDAVHTTDDAPIILYLGRITRVKRLDLLLAAMVEEPLRSLNARLIVAGSSDGTLPDPLRFVDRHQIQGRVEFMGTVDSAVRTKLMSRASVFVLPSEDESFGMAVAEAMAAGLPAVVGENVGFAAQAATVGALRLAPQTSTGLALAIVDALADGAGIGARARVYAQQHFTWPNAAAMTVEGYEHILRSGGRRAVHE